MPLTPTEPRFHTKVREWLSWKAMAQGLLASPLAGPDVDDAIDAFVAGISPRAFAKGRGINPRVIADQLDALGESGE